MEGNDYKKIGHNAERLFNAIFGDAAAEISYTKEVPDSIITRPEHHKVIKKLCQETPTVSLKGSNTWQIHLGRIEELTDIDIWNKTFGGKVDLRGKKASCGEHGISWKKQETMLARREFWERYFKKGNLLCYYNKLGQWTFFNFDAVIGYIVANAKWRLLPTGRIKGNFENEKGKTIKGVLTYEYRAESHKKCFVLGAHGGTKQSANGLRLFKLLQSHIPSVTYDEATGEYEEQTP
jgi:hypothetical protein